MAKKAQGAFRTISEVADWLDVPAHVLRFWESKFSQIKPVKRAGGRRYYRPEDMLLIGGIKKLLHDDGLTIRGVQKMISQDGVKAISAQSQELDMPSEEEAAARRKARRARRKEKSAASRAAKPPLAQPATDKTDASPSEEETKVDAEPDAASENPDNIVPFQGRDAASDGHSAADDEAEEASHAETPDQDTTEEHAVEEETPTDDADFDASVMSEDTVEFEDAEAEPAPEDDLLSAEDAPAEDSADDVRDAGWHAPSEAGDDDPSGEDEDVSLFDDIGPDPAPEDVKVSARIEKSEASLTKLRRHHPKAVPQSDTLTNLYDRLRDLRNRMDDDRKRP